MIINLLTDAPKRNLALMKLSQYHKDLGHTILLNANEVKVDYTYASVLFEHSLSSFQADEYGGPAVVGSVLPAEIEQYKADFSLYNDGCSTGYTFRPCFNKCPFCKVVGFQHPDKEHHSIFEWIDPNLKYIRLLNNNTFHDKRWRETFDEIQYLRLTLVDENGYDLRQIDDEKAVVLKATKFAGYRHFAWDLMVNEEKILEGIKILRKHKVPKCRCFVLVGYDTTEEEDIYRCQKLIENKIEPYIMPYVRTKRLRGFKRFMDSFMWRKFPTIAGAWKEYEPNKNGRLTL